MHLCHGRCPALRFPQIFPLSSGISAQLQAFCISKALGTLRTGLEHVQEWDIHHIPGQIILPGNLQGGEDIRAAA